MSVKMPKVIIFTDGGADPNPGPGGWGVVVIDASSGAATELSGGAADATNNRMELTAAIQALESLKSRSEITLHTDSEYLRMGITEWVRSWQANGWKTKRGAVLNKDLWQRLVELANEHSIHWEWVRGHTGNPYNERADLLASQQIRAHYANKAQIDHVDVEIFLRVSCPGRNGGWAAMIRDAAGEHVISGGERDTTSNSLDILAAAEALARTPSGASVRVWSGSDYVRNGATDWIEKWKKQGWQTKDRTPVKNRQLWRRLGKAMEGRVIEWPPAKRKAMREFYQLDAIARREAARIKR